MQFNNDEERVNGHLMDFMTEVQEWDLRANQDELTRAIHTLQMFVFQHALQRTGGLNGGWYGDPTS
jgi:hypothetical protein